MMLFLLGNNKFATSADPSPRRRQMRDEIWQIIVQLRTVKGGGVSQAFAMRLKAIADNSAALESGIVAWTELVEVLVQGAEQRYPDGRGGLKKSQVEAALHELINSDNFRIPAIPDFLQPIVIDLVLDWAVEVIVSNLNHYNLWDDSKPMPGTLRGSLGSVMARTMNLLDFLGKPIARLYVWLRYWQPLTPEVRAAVERARQSNLIATKLDAFGSPADFIVFLAQHRDQVIAGCRLFFEVVHMAQRFETLSGAGKKAYARDLIIPVLEELGFPVGGGLFGAIVSALIDAGIESAYNLLNKRAPELFGCRGGTNASA